MSTTTIIIEINSPPILDIKIIIKIYTQNDRISLKRLLDFHLPTQNTPNNHERRLSWETTGGGLTSATVAGGQRWTPAVSAIADQCQNSGDEQREGQKQGK